MNLYAFSTSEILEEQLDRIEEVSGKNRQQIIEEWKKEKEDLLKKYQKYQQSLAANKQDGNRSNLLANVVITVPFFFFIITQFALLFNASIIYPILFALIGSSGIVGIIATQKKNIIKNKQDLQKTGDELLKMIDNMEWLLARNDIVELSLEQTKTPTQSEKEETLTVTQIKNALLQERLTLLSDYTEQVQPYTKKR